MTKTLRILRNSTIWKENFLILVPGTSIKCYNEETLLI